MNSSEINNKIDISIVVATYNRAEMLRNSLKTLVSQETEGKFSYEICVVDDGSTDYTSEVVREMAQKNASPQIRYFHTAGGGPSQALNIGAAAARGEWLAFFDDDQWAEPLWLAELYKVAQERGVDCVDGPLSLDLPHNSSVELSPNWRICLGERFLGNCIVRSSKDHLGSGNLLIRKSVFTGLGAFDPNFPFYSYDLDLFWRLEGAGYYSMYSPHALVHHVIPESRLQIIYLVETCQRMGVTYAQVVGKNAGASKLAFATLRRLVSFSVRDILLYLIYRLLGPQSHLLDKRIDLWFALAFFRGALAHLLPKLFKQEIFINALYSSYRKRNYLFTEESL